MGWNFLAEWWNCLFVIIWMMKSFLCYEMNRMKLCDWTMKLFLSYEMNRMRLRDWTMKLFLSYEMNRIKVCNWMMKLFLCYEMNRMKASALVLLETPCQQHWDITWSDKLEVYDSIYLLYQKYIIIYMFYTRCI